MVDAWAIGAGLSASFASTTAAKVERVLLDLFACLGVDHELAYRYPAIVAGVGASGAFAVPVAPLCDVHADGQDVFAVLPMVQEVRAVAGLFAVVDRVEAPARAAG